MEISKFLETHKACKRGSEWALATGCQTIEEIWLRDDLPIDWRIWIATREGVIADAVLRKFACMCVREVWHLLTDERSRNAVEMAEKFIAGEATVEDLDLARDSASAAAWDAASAAAWAAASTAEWDAASAAAWAAARFKQNQILRELVPTISVS